MAEIALLFEMQATCVAGLGCFDAPIEKKKRSCARLLFAFHLVIGSMQVEIHIDQQLDGDRMAFVHRGPEPVLPHGFDRLFIQSHAEMPNDADILRIALAVDDELNGDAALKVRCASFGSKLRIDGMDDDWSTDASADAHYAAAIPSAAACTSTEPMPGADTAAETGAES